MVRTELKNGKAPGIDNVYNIILKKTIGTGFYKVLARAFTISLNRGFIPHVWKIAVLCMLIKPDKPPSQTASYRPISLLRACSHEPGTVNYPGASATSRSHDDCCPGATLPRVNFIAPGQVHRHLITTNLSEFL